MKYTYNIKFIAFFVFAFFLVGTLTIPQSFGQDPDAIPDAGQRAQAFAEDVIPSWIKNNAGWWADDKIDDFTFAQGVGFLIKNKINFMICYVTPFLSLRCQEAD